MQTILKSNFLCGLSCGATLLFSLTLVSLTAACGGANAFERLEKKDDKDKGKDALQKGDYDTAISELEAHLAKNPNDTQAKSMLATAKLRKAGVDEIQLAAKLSSGSGDWKSIMTVFPAGSAANVDTLKDAVEALESIPPSERTSAQSYQLAVAQVSLAVTLAKKAGGGSGSLSDAQVDAMSSSDVLAVFDSLEGTQQTVASSGSLKSNAGAQAIGGLAGQIAAMPGADDAERMRNYLKANN